MQRQVINPEGWRVSPVPLSPGNLYDDTLYVYGTLSLDSKTGATVGEGDIRAQTTRVLEQIKEIVETAGGKIDDIVYNQIYIKDLADFAGMNEVYTQFFNSDCLPARATLKLEMVRPEFLVEIASVARIKKK